MEKCLGIVNLSELTVRYMCIYVPLRDKIDKFKCEVCWGWLIRGILYQMN